MTRRSYPSPPLRGPSPHWEGEIIDRHVAALQPVSCARGTQAVPSKGRQKDRSPRKRARDDGIEGKANDALKIQTYNSVHALAAGEGALEGVLVGVLDIAANRQTAGQAAHLDPHRRDALLQIEGGRIAFH